jgi:hypothetical protein
MRKNIETLSHVLGLGWGPFGLGWVCHLIRFMSAGTIEFGIEWPE